MVVSINQKLAAEPATPSVKREKTAVFFPAGTSGTEIYARYFDEEYLWKLQRDKGIAVYDKMRRSDGQVAMLLSAVKSPILSAKWSIEPADESDQAYKIADFIRFVLFKDIFYTGGNKRNTWREIIENVLTTIDFGFSVFEIIHKQVRGHKVWGDYIGLADIGYRHQRSILEWKLEQDGSIEYVRQLVNGDLRVDVQISGRNLLVFSVNKEGDNYAGISMLRPCYGSWFRKDIYRKLQAIGIERAAKGIPVGKVPQEMVGQDGFEETLSAFQAVLDQLSAHEKNAIVMPAGFELAELKITHDSEKVQNVINSENIEMSKRFMTTFLELGTGGNSGSHSLGTDLSSIFLNGLNYIAEGVCEKFNFVIEQLVRANFGEQDIYPVLRVSGINDKVGKEMAEIISILTASKAIQPSTRMQRFVHNRYGLPDLDEDLASIADDNFSQTQPPPEDKKKTMMHDCKHAHVHLSEDDRKKFPISAQIEDYASDLEQIMSKSLRARSAVMVEEMARIIKTNRGDVRGAVFSVKMPKNKDYTTALNEWTARIVDDVAEQTEMEVLGQVNIKKLAQAQKKSKKKLRDKLTSQVGLVSEYQDSDIEKAVYFSFNSSYETAESAAVIKAITEAVEKQIEKNVVATQATNMASQIVNETRKETFLSPDVTSEIESFVFVNPDPISPICKNLNGKVFSADQFETSLLTPPLHHNCKSYIVAQTKGKAGNKAITGLEITGTSEEIEKAKRSKTL